MCAEQWRCLEVSTGGQIQVIQNHLPPNANFSSDFALFILKILEDLNLLKNIQKIFFKIRNFGGCSNRGTRPQVATAMVLSSCVPYHRPIFGRWGEQRICQLKSCW